MDPTIALAGLAGLALIVSAAVLVGKFQAVNASIDAELARADTDADIIAFPGEDHFV